MDEILSSIIIYPILSLAVFTGSFIYAIIKYGWLESWSAYYYVMPIVFVVGTLVTAVPIALGYKNESYGLYYSGLMLIGVVITAAYRASRKQSIIHVMNAMLCASLGSIGVVEMYRDMWYNTLIYAAITAMLYLLNRYFNCRRWILYVELLAFFGIPIILIIKEAI